MAARSRDGQTVTSDHQTWLPIRREIVGNASFGGVRSQIKDRNIHTAHDGHLAICCTSSYINMRSNRPALVKLGRPAAQEETLQSRGTCAEARRAPCPMSRCYEFRDEQAPDDSSKHRTIYGDLTV